MAIIELQGITKTYKESSVPVHALRGIDLSIDKGEFAAIVGPSGSGKTTLLNIIGGLDRPTNGTVRIDGTDISTMKPEELIDFRLHHIGFVFQSYNLIPVLTAKENVEFVLLLQNVSRSERDQQAMDVLARVGLAERAGDRPSELSGGQQQRVAVGRALASKPSFVLADEPTANLDSTTAESLLDLMEHLNRDRAMTFVFSTHDPRVMKRARRILTLEDGMITSDARQDEQRP
ncbi:MAG: ABC transporter ATP-binding protein [Ignavibacteriales bacterium]|nr:ABC transporter ATP-binding protein [Ignavibacteriales bacterium]